MAHPARNANPQSINSTSRIFFATTKTSMGRRLLQSERNANLLIDVLRHHVAAHRFTILDFVIMPDHVHLLIKLTGPTTIEKTMQWIKGGFSFRLKREMGFLGEVWQRGYSEMRVISDEQLQAYRRYIAENPVKAGLATSANDYPYCYSFLALKKAQAQGLNIPRNDSL